MAPISRTSRTGGAGRTDPPAGDHRASLAVLGAFLLLAVAWTWPLGRYLSSRVAHDPGDPVLNTWILWWSTEALPFTTRWWDAPIFFPMRGAFALSEHLAGIALFTAPLTLAGLSPLAAYNLALIASSWLSASFAYLLVRRLLASSGADPLAVQAGAICAGIAFGFAPYRAGQLAHLQVLTTQWMPLALLAMHAYLDDGRRRWLAVLGFAWVVQALSNGYYLLFFPVLVACWLAWFCAGAHWRRGAAILAAYGAASLLLLPGLLQYLAVHRQLGLERRATEMRMFSADWGAFLSAPHALAFWPAGDVHNQEKFLFVGVTVTGLLLATVALAALRRLRRFPVALTPSLTRRPILFYSLAAVALCWLAFGPSLPEDAGLERLRLYTVLTLLPGFDGLRVPARFVMLAYLCLAVAAGLALVRLLPSRPFPRMAVLALVGAALAADGWTLPMPLVAPPGRVLLPEVHGAAVLELPADDDQVNTAAMYRAIFHQRPLINGYSGHVPPHFRVMREGLRRGDPTVLAELARERPLIVAVHAGRPFAAHYHELVESFPGVQPLGATSAGRLFLVPAQSAPEMPPAGPPLHAERSEPSAATVQLDLGRPQILRRVTLPLGWHYGELNEHLEIQASEDGAAWTTAWMDWTGGLALRASLDDQREAPMHIPLGDVRARFIRVHPLPPALLPAVQVHGVR